MTWSNHLFNEPDGDFPLEIAVHPRRSTQGAGYTPSGKGGSGTPSGSRPHSRLFAPPWGSPQVLSKYKPGGPPGGPTCPRICCPGGRGLRGQLSTLHPAPLPHFFVPLTQFSALDSQPGGHWARTAGTDRRPAPAPSARLCHAANSVAPLETCGSNSATLSSLWWPGLQQRPCLKQFVLYQLPFVRKLGSAIFQ